MGGAARNAAARAAALHALRGVGREVEARNAARFPMVSVTLQPFAFMLRDGEQVVALPEGHRGVAWVRDARGRHHQQLRELTFEVRKARVTMPPGLYWNHEHADVTDAPPIDWQWPLLQLPEVEEALACFVSPLSALRIVDVIDLPQAPPFDVLAVQNFAGGRDCVFHPHMSARTASPGVGHTLDTWLQRTVPATPTVGVSGREDLAVANSCAYDILLHLYKAPIEALQQTKRRGDHRGGRFKGVHMTLQGLFAFFNPGAPFDASRLGLTLPQFRTFFEQLSLQLTVLDVAGAEVTEASFQPTHQNRKLSPWHVWVLHHDGHLFLLNTGLHTAKMTTFRPSVLGAAAVLSADSPLGARLQAIEPDAEAKPPSARCRPPSPTLAPAVFLPSLEALAALQLSGARLRVVCPVDMVVALHQLLTRCRYEPAVAMRGNAILRLTLQIDGTLVELSPPECSPTDRTVMLQTAAEFELFRGLQHRLVCALLRPDTISSYHSDLAAAFREMPRAPLVYGTGYCGLDAFDPEARRACEFTHGASVAQLQGLRRVASEHDMAKAYTAALLALQHIPVFSAFDRFAPFDACAPIRPDSLYVVRRPASLDPASPQHLLLDAELNLVTGRTLALCRDWPGVEVLCVARPSQLVPAADAHSAVKALWGSTLPLELKKFLPNKVVGLAGRRRSTRERTLLFRNLGEARCFRAALPGSSLLARTVGDALLYFVHHEQRAELENGFYPLQHAVYDWMRAALYQRAVAVGRPLLGVKTDALWFAGAQPDVAKAQTFAGIGAWGVRAAGAPPAKPPVVRPAGFVPPVGAAPPLRLAVRNEYDAAELAAVMSPHGRVLLLGDLPGVGKTAALKAHCRRDATLFVAPTNKLKAEFCRDGFRAVTLDALLGLCYTDGGEQEIGRRVPLVGIDAIVFDEIYFYPVRKLERIADFMRAHAAVEGGEGGVRNYATGDPLQNPPIDRLALSAADAAQFYCNAVSALFPAQLTLRHCKRVTSAAGEATLRAIKHRLFVLREPPGRVLRAYAKPVARLEDVTGTAVCYLNATAAAVNEALHARAVRGRADIKLLGGKALHAGLELVCRKRLEVKLLRDGGGAPRGVLHVNFSYRVHEVHSDHAVLDDYEGGCAIVPAAALAHFSYAHAFTGHSQQGVSVDGAVTVFDAHYSWREGDEWHGVTASWVYTALSRARDLSLVHVYTGAPLRAPEGVAGAGPQAALERAFARKIAGHGSADRAAGRTWEEGTYVEPRDVTPMATRQGGRCAACSAALQLSWTKRDPAQASIDRIDNAKESKENCRLVCLRCNKAKH